MGKSKQDKTRNENKRFYFVKGCNLQVF